MNSRFRDAFVLYCCARECVYMWILCEIQQKRWTILDIFNGMFQPNRGHAQFLFRQHPWINSAFPYAARNHSFYQMFSLQTILFMNILSSFSLLCFHLLTKWTGEMKKKHPKKVTTRKIAVHLLKLNAHDVCILLLYNEIKYTPHGYFIEATNFSSTM